MGAAVSELQPITRTRRIAALIAALLALAATDAAGRDCRDMPPGTTLKMPLPSMWTQPPASAVRYVSCERIGELYAAMRHLPLDRGVRENRDCHLLGAWLADGDMIANMAYGADAGHIVVCAGMSRDMARMVAVHENAHRAHGWRDDGPGKQYTLKAWLVAWRARK